MYSLQSYKSFSHRDDYDLVILGTGVSGLATLYFTQEKVKNILLISEEDLYPSTTLKSTAIVAKRATQNMSPLGELLLKGYDCAKEFFEKEKPHGVSQTQEIVLIKNEKIKDRYLKDQYKIHLMSHPLFKEVKEEVFYDQAYLISPHQFRSWTIEQTSKSHGVEYLQDALASFYKNEKEDYYILQTKNQQLIKTKRLVLASHHYLEGLTLSVRPFLKDDEKKLKRWNSLSIHKGSYYLFDDYKGNETKSFLIDGVHFILNAHSKTLIIGQSSLNQRREFITHPSELHHHLQVIRKEFNLDYIKELSLSAYETLKNNKKAKIITSHRSKGSKRMPWIEEIHPGLWIITAQYKNGYSLAFYAAKLVMQSIKDS